MVLMDSYTVAALPEIWEEIPALSPKPNWPHEGLEKFQKWDKDLESFPIIIGCILVLNIGISTALTE
jgi:hypothetical protein